MIYFTRKISLEVSIFDNFLLLLIIIKYETLIDNTFHWRRLREPLATRRGSSLEIIIFDMSCTSILRFEGKSRMANFAEGMRVDLHRRGKRIPAPSRSCKGDAKSFGGGAPSCFRLPPAKDEPFVRKKIESRALGAYCDV